MTLLVVGHAVAVLEGHATTRQQVRVLLGDARHARVALRLSTV
jgi:hypothetical protein